MQKGLELEGKNRKCSTNGFQRTRREGLNGGGEPSPSLQKTFDKVMGIDKICIHVQNKLTILD